MNTARRRASAPTEDDVARGRGLSIIGRVPRGVRVALNLAVAGGILAFLLWQIDVSRTVSLIRDASAAPLAGALAIFLVTTVLMAWRWQILLAAKRLAEPLAWLTKLYFIGYAAGQVLPTSFGGDAVRVVEHARRRPNAKGEAAAAVLVERWLGLVATLILVAVALGATAGRYEDVAVFYWIEAAFLAVAVLVALVFFSGRIGTLLRRLGRLGRALRLDHAAQSLHDALLGYRRHVRSLAAVLLLTTGIQAARLIAIWLCGEAVGIELSPLPYFILGPLLLLVMLVPFTVNGLGVREAFFIAFLGRFGIGADEAFAAGFLFYAVTIVASLPGALILLWRGARPLLVRAGGA